MNKTIASISVAVVLGGSSLSAQLIPSVADIGVTSDLTYATEYVFRGIERADHSFQPSVEVSAGDFYLGLWTNLAVSNTDNRIQRNEVNYYGGFALDVPGAEFLTLDLGVIVYHFPRASMDRNHEVYVGTKFDDVGIEGVSAAVYYFYDFDIRSHVVEGSLGYSFDLSSLNVPASVDVSGIYGNQFGSSFDRGAEAYFYYGASAEVPFAVNEFSTITAGVHWQTAERISNVVRDNLYWTLSYTAGF